MIRKKIIITDPQYILSYEEWNRALKVCSSPNGAKRFPRKLTEILAKNGHPEAVVGYIGCPLWNNVMCSATSDVFIPVGRGCFMSESGLICVLEARTPAPCLAEYSPEYYALFSVPKDAEYTIDRTNPRWSVVLIHSPDRVIYAKSLEAPDWEF